MDTLFMTRALQLAGLGCGTVSPNPMVGCVLVAGHEIIGEGWHKQFGGPHAEVAAVDDARLRGSESRLAGATAYVTLEPCAHFGKTPPCADLLAAIGIGRVVICNVDPNPLVKGQGIARLRQAGAEVVTGVMKEEGAALNRRFFTGMEKRRPYVILKWAQTADGFISAAGSERLLISSTLANIAVHRWRSEEDAILVGRNTALADNPRLNVRHWHGNNPVRIVLDRRLEIPSTYALFDRSQPTIVVNAWKEHIGKEDPGRYREPGAGYDLYYLKTDAGTGEMASLLARLYALGIGSVLVEGGARTHQTLLDTGLWDEIRIIRSRTEAGATGGIRAPLPAGRLVEEYDLDTDRIICFRN